jgi:hypothetical protein
MTTGIDFTISQPVYVAIISIVLFPFILVLVSKMKTLFGRNALQFFLAFLVTTVGWLISLVYLLFQATLYGAESYCVSFFLYCSALLVYLEIWALLSRGYTIGLLLTFYKSNSPLDAIELAKLYRGGEGLDWLIKHRFSGLISAKMIQLKDHQVVLSPRGVLVAFLYKLSVMFFGLRYSG